MPPFYVTATALISLANLILNLVLAFYLASLPQKSKATWLLTGMIASEMLAALTDVLVSPGGQSFMFMNTPF